MKGTKKIEVDIGTLVVTVECDEDEGYDGDIDSLREDVRDGIRDDIEALQTEGNGWVADDVSMKVAT